MSLLFPLLILHLQLALIPQQTDLLMSHDRRPLSREEEDYYYHQRSQSQGGNTGYYDDNQGNPYAYYSQPQASPDHGRNGSYHEHAIARDRDRDRYYARSEDSDSVGFPFGQPCSRCFFAWLSLRLPCNIEVLEYLLTASFLS